MTPLQLDDAEEDNVTAASLSNKRVADMTSEEVVEAYSGLVVDTSRTLAEDLQCPVDLDDIVGWGYQGLLEAHERFDPTIDTSFASFAFYRIRGAIYDGLRSAGWAVRGTAIQLRDSMAINDYLESNMLAERPLARTKSFSDCIKYLDRMVGDCVTICLIENDRLELVSHTEEATQPREVERDQLAAELTEAFERLTDNEREVLMRYHLEGESMTHIAEQLDMSKSWVSRINARALDKLRREVFDDTDPKELYMLRG